MFQASSSSLALAATKRPAATRPRALSSPGLALDGTHAGATWAACGRSARACQQRQRRRPGLRPVCGTPRRRRRSSAPPTVLRPAALPRQQQQQEGVLCSRPAVRRAIMRHRALRTGAAPALLAAVVLAAAAAVLRVAADAGDDSTQGYGGVTTTTPAVSMIYRSSQMGVHRCVLEVRAVFARGSKSACWTAGARTRTCPQRNVKPNRVAQTWLPQAIPAVPAARYRLALPAQSSRHET